MKRDLLVVLLAAAASGSEPRARAEEANPAVGVRARGSIGGSYAALFGVPFVGYASAIAVGGSLDPPIELYVGGGYAHLETSSGLALHQGELDGTIDYVAGLARLGFTGGLVYLVIPRVTEDVAIKRFGLVLALSGSIDLLRIATSHALFLALRIESAFFPTLLPRGTLALGFRF